MRLDRKSIREEFEDRENNIRNLVAEKMLTQAHADEMSTISDGIFHSLEKAFKMQLEYDMLRAEYLSSDQATIAADDQNTDNLFPSETNDFFNS